MLKRKRFLSQLRVRASTLLLATHLEGGGRLAQHGEARALHLAPRHRRGVARRDDPKVPFAPGLVQLAQGLHGPHHGDGLGVAHHRHDELLGTRTNPAQEWLAQLF